MELDGDLGNACSRTRDRKHVPLATGERGVPRRECECGELLVDDAFPPHHASDGVGKDFGRSIFHDEADGTGPPLPVADSRHGRTW